MAMEALAQTSDIIKHFGALLDQEQALLRELNETEEAAERNPILRPTARSLDERWERTCAETLVAFEALLAHRPTDLPSAALWSTRLLEMVGDDGLYDQWQQKAIAAMREVFGKLTPPSALAS